MQTGSPTFRMSSGGGAHRGPMASSRLQWGLLVVWVIVCIKLMKDSVDMMETKLQNLFFYEAFLYYNPLFMVALMVWLWGFNIWGFSLSRVSYPRVFDLDHNHLTHWDIWKIAMWLSVVVLTSMAAYLYLFSHGAKHLAASQPVLLYCILPLTMALPFDILYASSRYYFLNTLFRLTFPLQPISFADFFVADILTSLAKVLSDLERSICRMANNQVATIAWMDKDDLCGSHSLMIPCVLAFPYLCRFFQCLRQYSDTKERPCLFNALKYATAFPVIFLSATKYHVKIEHWHGFYKRLWIGSAILNSGYSFFWDITRDWDFGREDFSLRNWGGFPGARTAVGCFSGNCKTRNPLLRNNLYFPNKGVYYYVIVSNLILRGTWTYKLSSHLRNNYVLVWIFCFLEMVRRFQWVFFRVENEWNKMTMRGLTGSSQNLKDTENRPEEGSPLLPPLRSSPSMHRDG